MEKLNFGTNIRAEWLGKIDAYTLANRVWVSVILATIDDPLLLLRIARSVASGNGSEGLSIFPFGSFEDLLVEMWMVCREAHLLRGIRARGMAMLGTAYFGTLMARNFWHSSDSDLKRLSIPIIDSSMVSCLRLWPFPCS